MIKKEERLELKKYLSSNYVKEVSFLLKKGKIYNRNGGTYSDSMVRRVFNGYTENLKIEKVILEVYQIRKKKREQEVRNKRRILGLE